MYFLIYKIGFHQGLINNLKGRNNIIVNISHSLYNKNRYLFKLKLSHRKYIGEDDYAYRHNYMI